ncbi:hypothetical protein HL667_06235 [Bradyrhizobium sp. 83012]|uniref:Terminase small subunit n=1 Tax=Bradyrhizobium aeschynomenes TaxID=2734909 RepID=A0ABX2CAF5_9BRAD|nr:hypothetical protein [Bradyrhizobium aeschynomenes]NPU64590.1 hypothetical protein [Bradyrhizobium aeschynomenes]
MTNQGKATQALLEALHGALASSLADKIRDGSATAADLSVARQFLKDNGIDGIPKEGNGLDKLRQQLPFGTDDPVEDE